MPFKQILSARSLFSFVFSLSIFLILILGCVGGSGKTCVGDLTVDGKKYSGKDSDPAQAKRNTCSQYCIEGDPQTDAMYRIWLDSLSEKERKRVRQGVKGKWDAAYESESIKKHIFACEKKCLKDREIGVKCNGD